MARAQGLRLNKPSSLKQLTRRYTAHLMGTKHMRSHIYHELRWHYARVAYEGLKEIAWSVGAFVMLVGTFLIFVVPFLAYLAKN